MSNGDRCDVVLGSVLGEPAGFRAWRLLRVWWHQRRCPDCIAASQAVHELAETVLEADALDGATVERGPDFAAFKRRLHARDRRTAFDAVWQIEPWRWRWAASSALLALSIGVIVLRLSVPLNAEVLDEAVQAERLAIDEQDAMLEIRPLGFARPTLVSVRWDRARGGARTAPLRSARDERSVTVAEVLRMAAVDADASPLSASAYRRWQEAEGGRVARVTRDGDRLIVTTRRNGRQIGELVMDAVSHRVVRVTYVSRDLVITFREIVVRPVPRRAAETVTVVAMDPQRLERTELAARLVLQETGADLVDGLRVRRSGSRVTVAGVLPSTTRTAIDGRLAALQDVDLRVETRQPESLPLPDGLDVWRRRMLGEPAGTAFVAQFAERTARISRRVHLLHELSERYTQAEASRLPADARRTLSTIIDRHYRALVRDLRDIRPAVALSVGLGPGAAPFLAEFQTPDDWRWRIQHAQACLPAFEAGVATVLRARDLRDVPEGGAWTPLSQAYQALCAAVAGTR